MPVNFIMGDIHGIIKQLMIRRMEKLLVNDLCAANLAILRRMQDVKQNSILLEILVTATVKLLLLESIHVILWRQKFKFWKEDV